MSEKSPSTAVRVSESIDVLGRHKASFQVLLTLLLFAFGAYLLQVGNRTLMLLFIKLFVFGIAAMSFDLLFGYAGIMSFGQALFFGGSVYVIGLASMHTDLNYLQALPFALLAVVILAFLVGALALRSSGVYFAIITLAFGQLGYELVSQFNEYTGGTNGIVGIEIPTVAGIDMGTLSFSYYAALVVLVLTYVGLRRLVNSPFGRVLQGIRENEERIRMLGIDPYKYKLIAFTISGLVAGIGGILYPLFVTFISPTLLFWSTSGDILMMTLIGGFGTLWGSIVGAGVFTFLEANLSELFDEWRLVLGIIFMLIVLLFPSGIAGVLNNDTRTALPSLEGVRDDPSEAIRDFVNRYRSGGENE